MERVTDAAHQAVKTLEDKSEQLMHAQAQLTYDCRNYVKKQPLAAVSVAIAAGYLLGWAIHRR